MTSSAPAILAWIGGALFTAKMLVNPFVAAKFPYLTTERGFARRLPVELTMANDLPIVLIAGPRAHSWFNDVLLYFLDEHAYPPEVIDARGTCGRLDRGRRPRRHHRAQRLADRSPADDGRVAGSDRVHRLGRGGAGRRSRSTPDKPVTFDRAGVGRPRFHQLRLPAVGALDRRVHRAPAESRRRRTTATWAC